MAVLQGVLPVFSSLHSQISGRGRCTGPAAPDDACKYRRGFVSIGLPKGLRGMNAQFPRIHTSQTECKQTGNVLALGWLHGTRGAAGLRTVSDYVVKDPRGATWTG